MRFISYAQNYEDVMLWRALKDVKNGFYIDIGAQEPELLSVTKLFYDAGWRGINIDPIAEWHEKLSQARPRDINLQLAVGAETGEISFYETPGVGLSTVNKSFAERMNKNLDINAMKVRYRSIHSLIYVGNRMYLRYIS